jgi:recombination protein RecA
VERDKALEMAMSQIDKHFGKGSVMRMGEKVHVDVGAVPTGALALDLALGIGGLPRGRIVEIFGPESSGKSTLAMHVVAEAQRNGGVAAYIDAEHAMDPVYARAIGVNVDELLISQPDTGEQALEISDMLIRSGAIDVLVVDSVAALTPRAEIEGEMGDSHVGLQARLMSQALRKLTGTLSKTNTIAIFINQLREKIGVMYGCLSWDTLITLADGTQIEIGNIVNRRMPVEVLSYDPELDAVVPKKVVNWFDNGPTDQFLHFSVPRAAGRGRSPGFACTPNHQVRTPGGWREAQELAVGDRVLQAVPHHLSHFQWEAILGGLMGDGSLSRSQGVHAARYRFDHCSKQAEYCDWKGSHFANIDVSRSVRASDGVVAFDVTPLPELTELREAVYFEGKKVFSEDYLKQLTPLSLAIWYMDDGSFSLRAKGVQERTKDGSGRSMICVEAMEPTTRSRLVAYLADTWGINAKLVCAGARKKAVLVFPKDETTKLHALIAPFVHPSMQYKLLPAYRGRFAVEPVFAPTRFELMPMPIKAIRPKAMSRTHRYDIEVEGSHNYFAGGTMVHNSPEVTPGGRALKFYSSVRLDIRRIEAIKDGTEVIGNRTRVKVVKNKVSAPFRQAEFDIMFGKGISREGSLLDVGVDLGLVKKSGAWYTYDGEQLGQGRENAKAFLVENPEIMVEISERIRQQVAPPDPAADAAAAGLDPADDQPITLD